MYKLFISWTGFVLGFVVALIFGLALIEKPVDAASGTFPDNYTTVSNSFSYSTTTYIPPDIVEDVLTKKNAAAFQTPSYSRYAALTFDDGPSAYTPQILEILKKYNVRATFFVLGVNAQANPEIIRQLHKEGHVIANHTWSHSDMTKLSPTALQKEIASTNRLIEELTGRRPDLFRPPYGKTNAAVQKAIHAEGMVSVLWNVDPADWNLKKTTTVHARVQAGLLEKSLILLHDGGGPREKTVESLPMIIENLREKGYEFVTVPEYLNLNNNML